jgi:hypothetical protein
VEQVERCLPGIEEFEIKGEYGLAYKNVLTSVQLKRGYPPVPDGHIVRKDDARMQTYSMDTVWVHAIQKSMPIVLYVYGTKQACRFRTPAGMKELSSIWILGSWKDFDQYYECKAMKNIVIKSIPSRIIKFKAMISVDLLTEKTDMLKRFDLVVLAVGLIESQRH